jgi:2-polyprenyl-6-methoxyphenol hydroxylase-like FAD-dependent oxidoreductase
MKVAICGAGVAGPTLAYFLARHGHTPTLIERAPELRSGGYVIDFWGLGYSIAERMGIIPRLRAEGYQVEQVRFVGAAGNTVSGFNVNIFQQATHGRFTSVPRSVLARAIYGALEGSVETLFDETIAAVSQDADGVDVTLASGGSRRFDLLVGAGGLHSPVRRLCFGPTETFEVRLGYHVAAFTVSGYPRRDELTYVSHAEPSRQLARFALHEDRTMFFFIYHDSLVAGLPAATPPVELLRHAFRDSAWEAPQILPLLDAAQDLYFDSVSQIHMPHWSTGRVGLLGDAAAAVSLLAGEGTGLAMIEAYVLAGELERAAGDHRLAFERHEALLKAFIEGKQKSAAGFAGAFAPRTAAGIWFRNQVVRMFAIPLVADLFIGRNVKDKIVLPDYDHAGQTLAA